MADVGCLFLKCRSKILPGTSSSSQVCREEGLRAIIIDCSPFPYVDMTGLGALRQVYEDYAFLGIRVAFACVKGKRSSILVLPADASTIPVLVTSYRL